MRGQERELEEEGGAVKHYNGKGSGRSDRCVECNREPVSRGPGVL